MFKYMLVIDFDEYFVPFSTSKSVLYYTKKLIRHSVGGVVLGRQDYHCQLKNMTLPNDGNITKVYDTSISFTQAEVKALYLLKSLKLTSVHLAKLLPNYRLILLKDKMEYSKCYFAHFTRKNSANIKYFL